MTCKPSGLRQGGTSHSLKIMQTPDEFVILRRGHAHLPHHSARRPPPQGGSSSWAKDSICRWEGGTLVVDTIGFNDKSWLDSSGYPHGEKLHLIERFRRLDGDTLRYEVTIEDPEYYTRPWTTAWSYRHSPESRADGVFLHRERARPGAHGGQVAHQLAHAASRHLGGATCGGLRGGADVRPAAQSSITVMGSVEESRRASIRNDRPSGMAAHESRAAAGPSAIDVRNNRRGAPNDTSRASMTLAAINDRSGDR